MSDYFRINRLLDLYENLLTPRQRELMQLHFREDLSFSEMAEETGISKQAVSDSIRTSIKALNRYESLLHLERIHTGIFQLKEKYPELSPELDGILTGDEMEETPSGKEQTWQS